jgi:23S rRNA pseudouridine2605 synthase
LPESLPRLISVGRLDFNTEGLLLLTNDGDLARHLALPSTGWARRYRVRAHGAVEQAALDRLAGGLTVAGVAYGPVEAKLERQQGGNAWIALTIREGKNREVRRIIEHLGLEVNRLIRVSFGPFMLGGLEPGQIEEVEARVLRDQLGARQSRQFGVHRSPIRETRRFETPLYLKRKRAEAAPAEQRRNAPETTMKRRQFRQRRILPLDPTTGGEPRLALVEWKTGAKHSRGPGGGGGEVGPPEGGRRGKRPPQREQALSRQRSVAGRPARELDRERPRHRDAGNRPPSERARHDVRGAAQDGEERRLSKAPSEGRTSPERRTAGRRPGEMKGKEAPRRGSEMRRREEPMEGTHRYRKGKEVRPPRKREGGSNEEQRGAHSHGGKPRFRSSERGTASYSRSKPRRPRPGHQTKTP